MYMLPALLNEILKVLLEFLDQPFALVTQNGPDSVLSIRTAELFKENFRAILENI